MRVCRQEVRAHRSPKRPLIARDDSGPSCGNRVGRLLGSDRKQSAARVARSSPLMKLSFVAFRAHGSEVLLLCRGCPIPPRAETWVHWLLSCHDLKPDPHAVRTTSRRTLRKGEIVRHAGSGQQTVATRTCCPLHPALSLSVVSLSRQPTRSQILRGDLHERRELLPVPYVPRLEVDGEVEVRHRRSRLGITRVPAAAFIRGPQRLQEAPCAQMMLPLREPRPTIQGAEAVDRRPCRVVVDDDRSR